MASPKKTYSNPVYKYHNNIECLVDKIKTYFPTANIDSVIKAYKLAKKVHEGQLRQNGSPYFEHPFCVASILVDLKLDIDTIVTGFLHDVVEDTSVSLEEINTEFGKTVAFLVDGVSKVSKINFKNTQKKDSENMRKMIVAMASDVRIILVKLADRLHNMRTLMYLSPEKRRRVAQETLDIYAPLASRLGIHSIKIELEDLAFQYSDTPSYNSLVKKMDAQKTQMENYIAQMISILNTEINVKMNLKSIITGRPKNLYSIHQKIITQKVDYHQVYDILAFRICVENIEDCYKILGQIHSLWKPIPGRFKDYIAIPKKNNYQSLQTTVLGKDNRRFEVQIRTHKMHVLAERGIAAHWQYKAQSGTSNFTINKETLKQFNWLKDLVTTHQKNMHSGEFLESVKMDLFDSDIYIFTPTGDVKEFPKNATPIDFAYSIHTDVGRRITGAKVNKRLVPLKHKLTTGDTVEVITSRTQNPSKEWLKYCVTSKAKSRIKSFLKLESRKNALEIGQRLVEKALKKKHLKLEEMLKLTTCIKYMREKGLNSPNDLYHNVGYGKILIKEMFKSIMPNTQDAPDTVATQSLLRNTTNNSLPLDNVCPVIVDGLGNIMVQFAKCCRPLPGDTITGFISRGRGITIHRQTCKYLLALDSERYVDVQWNQNHREKHTHIVDIRIISHDAPGVLKGFSEVFLEQNINIMNLRVITNKDLKATSVFSVNVKDLKQLHTIMDALKYLKDVISVSRV